MHPRRRRLSLLALPLVALLGVPATVLAAGISFTVNLASSATGAPIAGATVTAGTYDAVHGQQTVTATDNGNGAYTVSDPLSLGADTWTVQAVYDSTSTLAQTVYENPGGAQPGVTLYWPVARESLAAGAQSAPADGSAAIAVTAAVYASDGTAVAGIPVTFSAPGAQLSVAGAVYTTTSGTAGATLTATGAGPVTVTASVPGLPADTVQVSFAQPAATSLQVSANPATVPADGKSAATVTAAVYDQAGFPLAGVPVTFDTSHGTLSVSGAVYTSAAGTAAVALTSTDSGTATVTATANGAIGAVTAQTKVTFTDTGGDNGSDGSGSGSGSGSDSGSGSGSDSGSTSGPAPSPSGIGGTADGTAEPSTPELATALTDGHGTADVQIAPVDGAASLVLSPGDLAALGATGGTLDVQAGPVTVDLPAADITPAALAKYPALAGVDLADAQVTLQIQSTSSSTPVPAGTGGTTTEDSAVYSFTLQVQAGGTTVDLENFPQAIPVTLAYTPGAGIDPELLAVYRLDPNGGAPTFIGGTADAATGTVTVDIDHFSQYAVLQFQVAFGDISGLWASHDIEVAAAHGITDGVSPGVFAPGATLTRATFVTMLARALGLPAATAATTFTDVPPSAWYAAAVAAAAQAGLVQGTSPGTFSPDAPITRESMAVLLQRAAAYQGKAAAPSGSAGLSPFADASTVAPWAEAGMVYAVGSGLIRGTAPSALDPSGPATRAQAVAVLVRYLFGSTGN